MIVYFSGNGNTKWCAETLATATNDKAVAILGENESTLGDIRLAADEPLGIFFPVHGWKPPRVVLDFLSRVNIPVAPSYCYCVCTCGDSIGDTMGVLRKVLDSRNLHLSSAFSILMPETYVCLPFMYTDTIANEQRKILAAEERMKEIATLINSRKKEYTDVVKGPIPWFFTHIVGAFFNHYMITDKPFSVDEAVCIHCGKCAKVCPIANISFDKKVPQWQKSKRCTCCMACYHHCPVHAINYGKITRRRDQYYFGLHPISTHRDCE